MPQIINTNIASMNAQRNLDTSGASLQSALQRLSSGLRINSAKDDAAGLAISERMGAQVRGLNQAARNANDAISLSQTAEGAISGMGDNLQRLRELAVQAANSTNSASDRATIQSEVAQLVTEIDRVATTTEFNGIKLLDGTFTKQAFQVGANANQTIAVSMDSARTSKLGSTQVASLTASNNGVALAGGDLILNGISVGASISTTDTASTASGSASAIAKAAAVNAVSSQTDVTASVNTTNATGAGMTMAVGTGTITINGVTTDVITLGGVDAGADRANVIQAINEKTGQTGVVAVDTGLSATGIQLTAADGRNIVVGTMTVGSASGTFTSATTGIAAGTSYGTYTLSSSKAIEVTGSTSIANADVAAGTYATQTAYSATTAGVGVAFAAADFKLNGVILGASLSTYDTASSAGNSFSSISKVATINAVSAQTGVTATANTNTATGSAMTMLAGTGTFTINGVTTGTITLGGVDAAADRAAVIAAINAKTGQSGVTAVDGGSSANGVKLTTADGRNIVVGTLSAGSASGAFTSATTGIAAGTSYGTFTLSSSKMFTVEAGTTGVSMTTIGMLSAGTYGAGKTGQALSTIDVSTVTGASNAITALDNAISSLNGMRADLGAIQNRFTSTVATLENVAENLTGARSRIRDTDFAAETAKLSRGQILQQAGVAMLAQANALPNNVLALLRG